MSPVGPSRARCAGATSASITVGDEAIRYTLLTVPVLWIAGRSTDHDAARALGEPQTA